MLLEVRCQMLGLVDLQERHMQVALGPCVHMHVT